MCLCTIFPDRCDLRKGSQKQSLMQRQHGILETLIRSKHNFLTVLLDKTHIVSP